MLLSHIVNYMIINVIHYVFCYMVSHVVYNVAVYVVENVEQDVVGEIGWGIFHSIGYAILEYGIGSIGESVVFDMIHYISRNMVAVMICDVVGCIE